MSQGFIESCGQKLFKNLLMVNFVEICDLQKSVLLHRGSYVLPHFLCFRQKRILLMQWVVSWQAEGLP
jgi:hypothetical protein